MRYGVTGYKISPVRTIIIVVTNVVLNPPFLVVLATVNTYGIFCVLQVQFKEGRVASDLRRHWHICL